MTSDERDPRGDQVGGAAPTRVVVARRSWAVPAIVVVAVAVVLLGLLGQKPQPPRPAPTPSPTPPPVAMEWTTLPLDSSVFEGALVGLVVRGAAGVLALGQDATDRHIVSWTSPDGRSWTRHDQPAGTFGGGVPDSAVAAGPGYVAAGYHASADGSTRDMWTSSDGVTWTRTPSPTGRGLNGIGPFVASGGSAVVVVQPGDRQALLSSRDGQVWAELPDPDMTLGRDPYVADVVATDAGFLAVGSVGATHGTVWQSTDGRDWSALEPDDPSVFADAFLRRVFRTHAGFLVTGFVESANRGGGPAAWTSSDGRDWTPVGDAGAEQGGNMGSLLALAGGDLGIGEGGIGNASATFLGSVDEATWDYVDAPTDAPLDLAHQAAVVDGRLLVLGNSDAIGTVGAWLGTLIGPTPAVAAASPHGTAAPASAGGSPSTTPGQPAPTTAPLTDRALGWHLLSSRDVLEDSTTGLFIQTVLHVQSGMLAFGSAGSDVAVWRSTDALHWQRLPTPPSMRGSRIVAAAVNDGRIVVIGVVSRADGSETQGAWVSTDGVAWTRAKGPVERSNAGLSDIVAGPDGFVVVGHVDGDQGDVPAVWTSRDGSAWSAPIAIATDGQYADMRAIARGPGGYVAVGGVSDDQGLTVGAAWTSPDGRTWDRVGGTDPFGSRISSLRSGNGGWLNDVVAGGPGFVVVGSADGTGDAVGAIFTSPDGRTWTRVPLDPRVAGQSLSTATTWAGGLAVGATDYGNNGGRLILLTSSNGLAWSAVDVGDAQARGTYLDEQLSTLTGAGNVLVGLGAATPVGRSLDRLGAAAIWIGAPPDVLVPDHVCPARIDDLVVLAAMTGADRAACIGGDHPVKVTAFAREGDNDCGGIVGTPDLSGCGPYLELSPASGGSALLTFPLEQGLVGSFGGPTLWTLTLRTDAPSPTCVPTPSPNGVEYDSPQSIELQCRAILHYVAREPAPGP